MKNPFKNTLFANSFHGILALVLVCLASSCTSLQSGQSFIGEYGGITYRYEVIVSYHNYVRVTPRELCSRFPTPCAPCKAPRAFPAL